MMGSYSSQIDVVVVESIDSVKNKGKNMNIL